MSHTQVLANLIAFEVEALVFIDSAISSNDKRILWELILELTGLSEENKIEKIFISVGKDYRGNILLVYKKKYYKDASTITNFLAVVIVK